MSISSDLVGGQLAVRECQRRVHGDEPLVVLRFLVDDVAVAQLLRCEEGGTGIEHQDGNADQGGGEAPADEAQHESGNGKEHGAHAEFLQHPVPDPALRPAHGPECPGLAAAFADVTDSGSAGQEGSAAQGQEEQGDVRAGQRPGDGLGGVLPHPGLLDGTQRRFLAGVVLGVAGNEDACVFTGRAGNDRGFEAHGADFTGELLDLRLGFLPAAWRLGADPDGVND